ncbi:7326_t:CDS:2, partial [Gigaspora margarita]
MRNIFETDYLPATSNNNLNIINTVKSTTRSMLDLDFDEDDSNIDELDCYISEKPANRDIDVLGWWKAHQAQFPRLACMARDYLAIPASTVASERAFSAGGNMITNERSSLAPKTVRIAQCLRSWALGPLKGKLGDLE